VIEPVKQPEQTKLGRRMLGARLIRVGPAEGYIAAGIGHWCPGCRMMHAFAIEGLDARGMRWLWNGAIDKPSFTPDRVVSWRGFKDLVPPGRCHYSLTEGVIHFFPDCTHALKGTRVPLPKLPGHLRD
jgi:hypothetical protein